MPPKTNEEYMREIRNIQPAHPLVYERIEQILTEKDQELQKARESERARIEDEFAKVAKYTQDFEPDAYGENPVNTSYYQLYEGQWEYIIKPKDQSELDQPIS